MAQRKIHKERYQKALDHINAKTDIEKQYLHEAKTCLRDARQSTSKIALRSYLDHIDFVLKDVFGVRVDLP